jgi:DNA gyrase subunit B
MHEKNLSYNADSIKVLKGLDAVRKRPGMYIGNTDDISGLHHMLYEVVDNAIDEALAGHCKNIVITLYPDNSASVMDDGRGIPTDIHKEEGISAAEVIMTQLHAGGKFSQDVYEVSGGLHGVGVSVVNALSSKLVLNIYQNKSEFQATFERGLTTQSLTKIGATSKKGTFIRFWPDTEIFSETTFDYKSLCVRFKELSFLNPGVSITLRDERINEESKFYDTGGVESFAKHICRNRTIINTKPLVINNKYNDVIVECAIYWVTSYTENSHYFTNTIPQSDGGTHVAGLRAGLTKSFQNFIGDKGTKAQQKIEFTGEDIREGMCCILAIKVADPKFSSQTKEKLVSSNVRQAVEHLTIKYTESWLEENPSDANKIINKIVASANAREAARKARDLSRKTKNNAITFQVAKKLAACSETDPSKCELFIVEGDSAGGSVKQARNRFIQAVLPLRGKILNIEKVNLTKALSSEVISTMIGVLGTGIGEEFNIEKLRYHKIIIMTDADVDGKHIESLLLIFFLRYMRPLLENGHIYLAAPPLYGIVEKKEVKYLRDEQAFREYVFGRGIVSTSVLDHLENKIDDIKEFLYRTAQIRQTLPNRFWEHAIAAKSVREGRVDLEETVDYLKQCEVGKWTVQDNSITKTHNGVITKYNFGIPNSILVDFIKEWGHIWGGKATIDEQPARSPFAVLDYVQNKGSRGLHVQRYKGLGEMPMPPLIDAMNAYKQLSLDDFEVANQLCIDLMGDSTIARKQLIEEYAHQADIDF